MPENQNMQKTSDNEAMLQEIVQNTEMGKNTLDELMGLTYDQKLKDEMMRQKNEYRRLNQQAHTALDAIGAQAKGQSAAARMSVSMVSAPAPCWTKAPATLPPCWQRAAARACWTASAPKPTTPRPAPAPTS